MNPKDGAISQTCAMLLVAALAVVFCVAVAPAKEQGEAPFTAFVAPAEGSLAARFAPIFVVEQADESYNLIGTPSAAARGDKVDVFVDSAQPAIYTEALSFSASERHYRNLFYRVHFERSPFTLVPFNASAGENVGIMAVVTLDESDRPVLLTTVHTCGCYHAIIPTNFLPESAYPDTWDKNGQEIYGEHLTGHLDYSGDPSLRPTILVRSGTHRIMEVSMRSLDTLHEQGEVVESPLQPVESLKLLKTPEGEETSFYFEKGRKRGLVKGAHKPWETLLFGLWIGDAHVGQDREFGSKEETGRLFYTTLNPRKKQKSDMSDFAGFLAQNGWKL